MEGEGGSIREICQGIFKIFLKFAVETNRD